MRYRNIIFLLFAATVCLGTACANTIDESKPLSHKKEIIEFYSKSLDATTTCTVYTPDPIKPGKQYPVFYILHGYGGSHNSWTQCTSMSLALMDREVIAVMPNGANGWFLDSPIVPKSNYESLIVKDVIPEIDRRYPTYPKREGRAIFGLSMGGHGAFILAEKHPELFASVSSLSGVLNLSSELPRYNLDELLGKDRKAKPWHENNALELSDALTTANIALMIDCGEDDMYCRDAYEMHEKLAARGVQHKFRIHPGNHIWSYWDEHLGEHIAFHDSNLKIAMQGKPFDAGQIIKGNFEKKYMERVIRFEKETAEWLAQENPPRPIVLLGSSTIQGFNEKKLMPGLPVVNRGISADRIGLDGKRGLANRIFNTVIALKPKAVIINNGTNDLSASAKFGEPNMYEVASKYREVVTTILKRVPDCHVYIDSCHPTRGKSVRSAYFINRYNKILSKMADELGDNVHYIDHATAVTAPDGTLNPEFAADGLHLNQKGNAILRDKIIEALKQQGLVPDK
ncbi:hypothetical protein GX645_02365 [Candidatus Sumerlaeota bacterium]|nr:hypothetical protein [Candidatus Sumerlaeota bacterium]